MKRSLAASAVFIFALALCFIAAPSTSAGDARSARTVTFSKDVAPILFKNCATCHRQGELAPMSLLTYKDARPWARSIKEKVVTRQMPPWHADPQYGHFVNDTRLSQEQIGDHLGLTLVHVNRTLRRLREERIALVDRQVVIIQDIDRMRQLARGLPEPAELPVGTDAVYIQAQRAIATDSAPHPELVASP